MWGGFLILAHALGLMAPSDCQDESRLLKAREKNQIK